MTLDMGALLGSGAAGVALLGGIVVAARWFRKAIAQPLHDFLEDWRGEPARPGVRGRPGVMTRLAGIEDRQARIEAQLLPNGGHSVKDQVTRIERKIDQQAGGTP